MKSSDVMIAETLQSVRAIEGSLKFIEESIIFHGSELNMATLIRLCTSVNAAKESLADVADLVVKLESECLSKK